MELTEQVLISLNLAGGNFFFNDSGITPRPELQPMSKISLPFRKLFLAKKLDLRETKDTVVEYVGV